MQLAGYEILSKIGEGGMSRIYKGRQESLNRPVAVKFLLENLLEHSEAKALFEQESLLIARLHHPNIIQIIDRGIGPNGMPYFVMEYIDGQELTNLIRGKKLNLNSQIDIALQLCKGLAYAHKNGVIHRDIKPANVLVDESGHAKLLDFGIAQFTGEETSIQTMHSDSVVGTHRYMAPEIRKSGSNVTQLADIYSLGALFHELFSDVFPGDFSLDAIDVKPDIPEAINALIKACLNNAASKRPQSADALRQLLLEATQGSHLEHTPLPTQAAPRLKLLDVLKEQGNGGSYLYQDTQNKRLIVVKKRPISGSGLKEAQRLQSLQHMNIASIYECLEDDTHFRIHMEYAQGGSLSERMAQPYALADFHKIALSLCGALNYAHKNHIIHGHIHPGNILFDDNGRAKFCDFMLDGDSPAILKAYAPPLHETASDTADIYSCAAVFYHMLLGRTVLWQNEELVHPWSYHFLPKGLRLLLESMLERHSGQRPQSMTDVLDKLHAIESELFQDSEAERTRLLTDIGRATPPTGMHLTATEITELKQRAERRFPWKSALIILLLIFPWIAPAQFAQLQETMTPYWNQVQPYIDSWWHSATAFVEKLLKQH